MWCPLVFGLTYGLFNILYIVAFNGTDPFGHDYVYSIIGPVHLKLPSKSLYLASSV